MTPKAMEHPADYEVARKLGLPVDVVRTERSMAYAKIEQVLRDRGCPIPEDEYERAKVIESFVKKALTAEK